MDSFAAKGKERTYSWAENAPAIERDELDAITEDAARFAKRSR